MGTSPEARSQTRQVIIVAALTVAIVASAIWIYFSTFRSTEFNRELHQAVGQTLAEETAHVVGHFGKIVIVSVNVPDAPELKVQVEAFEKHLKVLGGITVTHKLMMDPGDNPKYRAGAGLSSKHLLKIIRKNQGADAIVSFIGIPPLTDAELLQCKSIPKLISETHSPERLLNLLDKKILLAAVVPRFEFPAPGPRKPQTSRQWFDRYFQVVGPGSAVPVDDAVP